MKTFVLIILAVFVHTLSANAQGIQFSKLTFEEAKAIAVKENKKIFVDVMASWCGPCKKMQAEVFPLKEVGDYFNANFVSLKLDGEKETDHGVFTKAKPQAFPTYMWLDNRGNLLDIQVGYMQAPGFLEVAKKASLSDLVERQNSYSKRWDAGERSPELVNKYVYGIVAKVNPEKVRGLIETYLSGLTEEETKSGETALILERFMSRPVPGIIFNNLTKYADEYEKYIGYPAYRINMYRIVVRNGNAALAGNNVSAFEKQLDLVKTAPLKDKDMYLEIIDAEKDLHTGKYEEGFNKMIAAADKYGQKNPYLYRQFCYSLVSCGYMKNAPVEAVIQGQLVDLASKAFELYPSQETVLYLGAAYAHGGDYKKAYETTAVMSYYEAPKLPGIMYKERLGFTPQIETEYGSSEAGKKLKSIVKERSSGASNRF